MTSVEHHYPKERVTLFNTVLFSIMHVSSWHLPIWKIVQESTTTRLYTFVLSTYKCHSTVSKTFETPLPWGSPKRGTTVPSNA